MMNMDDQISKLKKLLGVETADKEFAVSFALDTANELIVNYCHISEIPEGLSNTVLRIAMDIYRNEQPGESGVPQAVLSVKTGDTQTNFGTAQTAGYGELLRDYKKQLNRYRRLEF